MKLKMQSIKFKESNVYYWNYVILEMVVKYRNYIFLLKKPKKKIKIKINLLIGSFD